MGEKIAVQKFENYTKFKYCFDDYDKCDEKFAIDRCFKIREDNVCLKQEKGCKFREKDKRCCLMYKCEENNGKEEGSTDFTDVEVRKKLKMAKIEDITELNTQIIDNLVTEISTQGSRKYGDEKEEGNGQYEKDLDEDEERYDNQEETRGMTNNDMEDPNEMKKSYNQNEDYRDQNNENMHKNEIGNDPNENVKKNNEGNVNKTGEGDETMKKTITDSKNPSKSEPKCIEGIQTEEECKYTAQSWCDQQKCESGQTGRCQYKMKDKKCCKKYKCAHKVNLIDSIPVELFLNFIQKHEVKQKQDINKKLEPGETIVHYTYKGHPDLPNILRPHHCNRTNICPVILSLQLNHY